MVKDVWVYGVELKKNEELLGLTRQVESGKGRFIWLLIELGAVKLRRWFEKTEMVFGISECAEGKKVKFAAATLQGPALT
ncbi:hypothetical protein Tco_1037485 [Tanacetum coccineum]